MCKCCICGRDINSNAPILFMGKDGKEHLLCGACDKQAIIFFDSSEEQKIAIAANYFAAYIDGIVNQEVRTFISGAIAEKGFRDAKEIIERPDTSESVAGLFLRALTYIAFFISLVLSIKLGKFMAKEFRDNTLGILIALSGIIVTGMFCSFIFTYLNLVKDVRTIKAEFLKVRYKKKK